MYSMNVFLKPLRLEIFFLNALSSAVFPLILFSFWPLKSGLREIKCRVWKYGAFYLFKFGQSQRVVVFDFELHKAHVGWVGELSDDAKRREQSGGKKHRDRERMMGKNNPL